MYCSHWMISIQNAQMKNPDLPDEILIEIFSSLPAKSVGRFRCLSKFWGKYLSTSQFVNLHLRRKSNQEDVILLLQNGSLYTIRSPINNIDAVVSSKLDLPDLFIDGVFGFLPDLCVHTVIGSCNGLVLMLSKESEIFVLNPLTLHQASIRNSPVPEFDAVVSYGFGYDSSRDDYKIVRLYNTFSDNEAKTMVDVFSMKNGVWKSIDSPPYYIDCIGQLQRGYFVNGAIHWIAEPHEIVAFDTATESFHGIPVPNDIIDLPMFFGFSALGDHLFYAWGDYVSGTGSVWIMKEYGQVNSWTKFSIMGLDMRPIGNPLCFIGENDVVFLSEEDTGFLIVWNLTEGTTKDLMVTATKNLPIRLLGCRLTTSVGELDDISKGVNFVESLVSPIYEERGLEKDI